MENHKKGRVIYLRSNQCHQPMDNTLCPSRRGPGFLRVILSFSIRVNNFIRDLDDAMEALLASARPRTYRRTRDTTQKLKVQSDHEGNSGCNDEDTSKRVVHQETWWNMHHVVQPLMLGVISSTANVSMKLQSADFRGHWASDLAQCHLPLVQDFYFNLPGIDIAGFGLAPLVPERTTGLTKE
ncbi:hypothetical protein CCUS01_05722 [Colletotrichum cuscutae]|uniref:Uncharacterized protein n=1 Tax=Colletotrichum cuscutae TaxID=1209917 RepID=A0AAI9V8X0_9PEZI|nr:hypothetical protein CCUS01_05722 [Colletotrichum cuscutae]